MKITIDTKNKTIQFFQPTSVSYLKQIEKILGDSYNEYTLLTEEPVKVSVSERGSVYPIKRGEDPYVYKRDAFCTITLPQ